MFIKLITDVSVNIYIVRPQIPSEKKKCIVPLESQVENDNPTVDHSTAGVTRRTT